MSEHTKTDTTTAAETAKQARPMDDAEAAKIVGGTGDYTQEQYDTWEEQFANGEGQGEGFGE